MPVRLGVDGREEAPLGTRHLAQHEVEGEARHAVEARPRRERRRLGVEPGERRVVVEHLLEVRHEPRFVRRVPVEAAGQLVHQAAAGHAVERRDQHLARLVVGGALEQEEEVRGRRELRGRPEAAPLGVEAGREPLPHGVHELGAGEGPASRASRAEVLLHRLGHHVGLLEQLGTPEEPRLAQALQDPRQAGAAPGIGGREVRPREEGLEVGGEEDRVGPAARARDELRRGHVDLVHVGPLLAVDLDADESLVHLAGDLGDGEALPLHHVTPVAGRVADREEDRLVLGAGAREGLLAPRVPVDRVVFVEEEVGARLTRQTVRHAVFPPKRIEAALAASGARPCMSAGSGGRI